MFKWFKRMYRDYFEEFCEVEGYPTSQNHPLMTICVYKGRKRRKLIYMQMTD